MGPAGWLCIGQTLSGGMRAGELAVLGNLTAAGNGVNWTVRTKVCRYARPPTDSHASCGIMRLLRL